MDQGLAAIWAAGIGGGAAVVTAAVAWLGARTARNAAIEAAREAGTAQVEAAMAGVKAQMAGQRAERLWEAERQATASYISTMNGLRTQMAHVIGLFELAREEVDGIFPGADRVAELTEIYRLVNSSYPEEVLWRFSTPEGELDAVQPVKREMLRAVGALQRWAGQRASENEADDERHLLAECMAAFGGAIEQFTLRQQRRFSSPPTLN